MADELSNSPRIRELLAKNDRTIESTWDLIDAPKITPDERDRLFARIAQLERVGDDLRGLLEPVGKDI